MAILVTGAAGFIGSHTAVRLLRRGEGEVIVGLDNLDDFYSPDRKRQNLSEVARQEQRPGQFVFVEGDVRDRALVTKLFKEHQFRSVIHLAARVGVKGSVQNPWLTYDVNVMGTLNLLEAVREQPDAKGQRANVVFASTSLVYGRTDKVPFVETDAADRPLAPYPASKRSGEMLGFTYHHLHDIDFTAVRFFTVYGPRGRPEMLAYKVLNSAFAGESVPLYNGGQMHRDWTFIDDIVSGIVAASNHRLGFEVLNLGRGEPVLLAEFVETLEFVAGKKAKLEHTPMPHSDIKYTYAAIDKAQKLIGYNPKISFEEGIQRFYSWYAEHVLKPGR
ncbi:MAG TPA: SDR family NAD(P)-dependent oxidoreductase [Polyangiaceae bacterium]|nr:SDR family NAD(P)-dependent oxidoreductase [Polyangiaceae bacterium]